MERPNRESKRRRPRHAPRSAALARAAPRPYSTALPCLFAQNFRTKTFAQPRRMAARALAGHGRARTARLAANHGLQPSGVWLAAPTASDLLHASRRDFLPLSAEGLLAAGHYLQFKTMIGTLVRDIVHSVSPSTRVFSISMICTADMKFNGPCVCCTCTTLVDARILFFTIHHYRHHRQCFSLLLFRGCVAQVINLMLS